MSRPGLATTFAMQIPGASWPATLGIMCPLHSEGGGHVEPTHPARQAPVARLFVPPRVSGGVSYGLPIRAR
jgi:hypothetical protein